MEPFTSYYLDPFKAAAASLGMEATVAPVYDMIELERVVATSAREPNSGLIVMPDAFTIGHHEDITSSIARYRVPTVYPFRIFAEVGGLVSYGSSALDEFRRAASYADRILKGANVCLAFAGMQAVEAGYNVRGVVEASGGLDVTTRELATARIKDHGITPVNWNHACGPYSQSRPHTARLLGESYE